MSAPGSHAACEAQAAKLRSEAANHRRRLRIAEARSIELAALLREYQQHTLDTWLAHWLLDPSDFTSPLEELLDADGRIDYWEAEHRVRVLLIQKPHLAAPRLRGTDVSGRS
ncbi:hypothetical protein [Agrococcus sp. SCSIO52902]|uniref:hypothetical protein n=1 Tax=Agrococcus sp. SCSIO52902 TaxID=2933290 RepID=UPI001FF5161E|nr:hypothetical protein [Agrococcus sp. SCSIO52902]UOW00896.1 hypothetical protein MU522_00235 [Agrococcus sp. SCSIO52902]